MAGSFFDLVGGTAHLLEHLVFDGTEAFPDKEKLSSPIHLSGGITRGTTTRETARYLVKSLHGVWDESLYFLSQIVLHPLLRQEDIDLEKNVVRQEIAQKKSDYVSEARRSLGSLLYPSSKMGLLIGGEVETLERIDRDTVAQFWVNHYGLQNAGLSICGDVDVEKIHTSLERLFGKVSGGERKHLSVLFPNKTPHAHLVDGHIEHTFIALGYPGFTQSDRYCHAARVFAAVLGGRSGRLPRLLRDKEAVVYDVRVKSVSAISYGIFSVETGVSFDALERLFEIIARELREVASKGISKAELETAKNKLVSEFSFAFENSDAVVEYYSDALFRENTTTHMSEQLSIRNVSAEDVQIVAQHLLKNAPQIVVVSPKVKEIDGNTLLSLT